MWLSLAGSAWDNDKTDLCYVYDRNKKQGNGEFPKIDLGHFISPCMLSCIYTSYLFKIMYSLLNALPVKSVKDSHII